MLWVIYGLGGVGSQGDMGWSELISSGQYNIKIAASSESMYFYKSQVTAWPAAERMSMMVSTVSKRTALPAFRLVSVLVAT